MAIVAVGMLDEREEALRLIKDQIEKRGHQPLLIDISIGTGAIESPLKPDIDNKTLKSYYQNYQYYLIYITG